MTPGALVGQVVADKYRIDSIIGEGGMGYVVAAHHMQLETKVAIKLMRPELAVSGEAVERFAREARAAVRITSQHVARVFDVGTLPNGAPYMVMEFLEGSDLSSIVHKRGPLPIGEAVDYVLQACEAIGEAHQAGIVHRDLKPANLFCARRADGMPIIKVLDFGISKLTGGAASGSLQHTKTTAIMGSPFYMSPEQMESTRGVDARTDIWGIGVILYELVTGRTPFEGSALPEICLRVATQQPPSMRTLRADAPAALELVILRCLEKDRDKRYGNVARLAVALRDFATPRGRQSVETILRTMEPAPTGASAAPDSPAPPEGARTMDPLGRTQIPMQGGKKKTLAAVLGVGALAVVGGVALFAMRASSATVSTTLVQTAAATPAMSAPIPTATAAPTPTPTAQPQTQEEPAAPAPAAPPTAAAGAATKKSIPLPKAPPKPKSNCDPNFYLDAQGEKHFKPECFR
jgi:serine/threonine-protein kinase